MYVVLAWFADRSLPAQTATPARERFDAAVSALVTDAFIRHVLGGDDWGSPSWGAVKSANRWDLFAQDGGVTAVSLGLPIGLDLAAGPVRLARRLLEGRDVHADVLPPFGLVALDSAERLAIRQDWLGMCRLFTGRFEGITAFCNRPSLLTTFLDGAVKPDLDGWTSYAICGHFGGEASPVRGARLLRPGERVAGRRRTDGGWDLAFEKRFAVDEVITVGIDARGREPIMLSTWPRSDGRRRG